MTSTEIAAFNVISLLVGFFVGNRLAIGRDKRREFNSLINLIRCELLNMKITPTSSLSGAWMITFTLIHEKLPFWKRKGFNRAVENYKKSKSNENVNINIDGMGGWSYKNPERIVHAVNDLLKYLKPK